MGFTKNIGTHTTCHVLLRDALSVKIYLLLVKVMHFYRASGTKLARIAKCPRQLHQMRSTVLRCPVGWWIGVACGVQYCHAKQIAFVPPRDVAAPLPRPVRQRRFQPDARKLRCTGQLS
jgi:hypothetical protein